MHSITPKECHYPPETSSHFLVEKLHKGADFLYGVLIAVSIEKAIEGFLHVSFHDWFNDPAHPHVEDATPHASTVLILWRVMVLLVMVARFYIGSIRYFAETYKDPHGPADSSSFRNRFSFDFFAGLMHFSFFFALGLAVTIPAGNVELFPCFQLSSFSLMLIAILLFDLIWLVIRLIFILSWQRKDTRSTSQHVDFWKLADKKANDMIWKWGKLNFKTTAAISLCLFIVEIFWRSQWEIAESVFLIPLFVVSLMDFLNIVKQ